MLDEAFFVRDVKAGRKYWSPVAKRIFLLYVGNHESLAVYGTVTINGANCLEFIKNSTA